MNMRLIGRFLDNWGTEVEKIAHGQLPLTDLGDSNISFPFQEVQQYTTQYIVNKKERPVAGLCDERLIKLIQKSDSKQIALAACTHLLSPQAVRTLIVRDFSQLHPQLYLQLILVAHHGTPNAVEQLDSQRAKILLGLNQASNGILGNPDGLFLKALFDLIKTGVAKTSLLYSILYTQALSAIPTVAAALVQHRIKHQWNQAWIMISWISDVSTNEVHLLGECLDPIELLDRNFRAWRMWAAWRPVESQFSPDICNEDQRTKLHEYLDLEGPDDRMEPRANVCDRTLAQGFVIENSIARIGHTEFTWNMTFKLENGSQEEARGLLRRMFRTLGQACHTGPLNVELFIELYWGNQITTQSLDIMDAVAAAAQLTVTKRVLDLYTSIRKSSLEKSSSDKFGTDKLNAALYILRLLHEQDYEELRNSATGKLAADVFVEEIQDAQAKLLISWEAYPILMPTINLECILTSLVNDVLETSKDEIRLSSLADNAFFDLLKHWPTYGHLCDIQAMRVKIESDVFKITSVKRLQAKLTLYLKDMYIKRGVVDQDTRDMMKALITFFKTPSLTLEHQHLAIFLADGPGKFRTTCIARMDILSHQRVAELAKIMMEWPTHWELACVSMARFLVGVTGEHADEIVDTWRPVLYRMFKAKGMELVATATTWSPEQYVQFFGDIGDLFGDSVWNPKLSPPILDPTLQCWGQRLLPYLGVLLKIESDKRGSVALSFFMTGAEPWILEGILCHLHGWSEDNSMHEASYCIVGLLSEDNVQEVYDVLCSISLMSSGGTATCVRLLDLCYNGNDETASILLAGWLQDSAWEDKDSMGFKDLARLLHVCPIDAADITTESLEAVATYMDTQYTILLESAQMIDALRVELKAVDHEGMSQLLYDHQIEDTTSMEDAFAKLPVELLNVVEKIDESEVEIIFPLTDITPLHRVAMGIGNAQSLLIRLYIGDYGSQPKFCIHLDNEPKLDSHDVHSQWTVFSNSKAPELPICHGTVTPATYQLARVLSRFLAKGSHDLLSIHTLVTRVLKTMGYECLICGSLQGAELRRATTCDAWECLHIFSQSPIEIRLGDIRTDPLAVDMILTMIHNSITSGFHNILPNCPFDQTTCLTILHSLPKMEAIQRSKYLWATIKDWQDGKSEQFLTWAICSFRGFLSTATGNLRIPSLPPGTLQFILANAAPTKESTFASELRNNAQQSQVMFHGTTLDRLYLIMHQGLKIMSGTPLQAYGAAYGTGIYLAQEPATSWAYAKTPTVKVNWSNSVIKNERVLLGCEMSAPRSVGVVGAGGIHVVPTEASVMVRYIFVVPSETVTMPISGHIAPAMMSVYTSLRSRAL